jgi:hypothetical protein
MADKRKQSKQDIMLRSLKRRLRDLAGLQPPPRLKAKLVAAIAPGRPTTRPTLAGRPVLRIWDFGVTAAPAVLVFALLLVVNYGLSVPVRILPTQVADTSLCYLPGVQGPLLSDQNNMLIEDTNYTIYNGRP